MINLRIKSASGGFDPEKVYSAVAWASDVTDRQGEKFDASTFDLTVLQNHPLPLLFAHDHTKIAGSIDRAYLDERGDLVIDFKLADTALGREMATLIESGSLSAVSVGYLQREAGGSVKRELVEVSLVSVPANPGAIISRHYAELSGEKSMSGPALVRNKGEQQKYSVSRFLLGLADPMQAKHAGFEFEVSREIARKSGKPDSAMIPWSILAKSQDSLTPAASGAAGDLGMSLASPVTDDSMFMAVAAATFKGSIAARAGINFHQAPSTSEYKVPRLVQSLKADWVARDTALGESDALFDTVSATPHTAGGLCRVMRSALLDCTPAMDAIVQAEIRKAVADAIDSAVIGGSGNANAPQGLLDILTSLGTLATGNDVLKMIRAAMVNDDQAQLKLISGHGFGVWASQQPLSASLNQTPLMQAGGFITGAPGVSVVTSAKLDVDATGAMASTVPVFLGDSRFAHLVVFGGLEVATNPYAEADWNRGSILVRAIADVDFLVTDASRWSLAQATIA